MNDIHPSHEPQARLPRVVTIFRVAKGLDVSARERQLVARYNLKARRAAENARAEVQFLTLVEDFSGFSVREDLERHDLPLTDILNTAARELASVVQLQEKDIHTVRAEATMTRVQFVLQALLQCGILGRQSAEEFGMRLLLNSRRRSAPYRRPHA